MAQQLKRGDEVLVEAKVEAAIIGENGRPRRFPREWIAAFMPKALPRRPAALDGIATGWRCTDVRAPRRGNAPRLIS